MSIGPTMYGGMRAGIKQRLYGCVAAFVALLPCAPASGEDSARIDLVKAAFILNIARFVSWPAEAFADQSGQRLRLCYSPNNPLSAAIQTIRGKKVGGRRLAVARIHGPRDDKTCQILLLAPSEAETFSRSFVPGPARPLLTITDMTAANGAKTARPDVMVSLVRNGTRIGFEINLARVREAGLHMSSKLLKLAKIVGDRG